MGQILVRNIDDAVLQRFREQAKREGKSTEQLAREAIESRALPSREEIIRQMDEIRARSRPVDRATADEIWEGHRRERDDAAVDVSPTIGSRR